MISLDHLPVSVREKADAGDMSMTDAFRRWLLLRAMPEERKNLQGAMLAVYGLFEKPKEEVGDARRLRHMSAALTYYQSGFDRFTLIPETTCTLPLGTVNRMTQTEYNLNHKEPAVIREESTNRQDGLEAFLCHEQDDIPIRDYTVNSTVTSNWFTALCDED